MRSNANWASWPCLTAEVKNEINARLRQQVYEHKQKIQHLETQAELRAQDRLDLTSDMARQFKTMQAELISEVNRLENITFELQTKLTGLQTVYADEKKRHAETVSDKDATIEELNMKMSYMTSEFETMLAETLSKITKKLEIVSTRYLVSLLTAPLGRWKENDQISLSEQNARRLDDFQLTRLV
ncbi:hypothetical protein HDU91_005678 [Kappamyces sp. JEL0680]|nr:hypothetical protein HDU91_005678 [Kappamyces sp. JEL0680]